MANRKLIIVAGILLVGFGMGRCAADPGETKVIRVPKYITHVETKTISTQTAPPESCVQANKLIVGAKQYDLAIEKAASQVMTALEAVSEEQAIPSTPSQLTKLRQAVYDAQTEVERTTVAKAEYTDAIQGTMKRCAADTERAAS